MPLPLRPSTLLRMCAPTGGIPKLQPRANCSPSAGPPHQVSCGRLRHPTRDGTMQRPCRGGRHIAPVHLTDLCSTNVSHPSVPFAHSDLMGGTLPYSYSTIAGLQATGCKWPLETPWQPVAAGNAAVWCCTLCAVLMRVPGRPPTGVLIPGRWPVRPLPGLGLRHAKLLWPQRGRNVALR